MVATPLEAIIRKALGKYFEIFLKDFDRKDLNLKFFSGEANLKNVGKEPFGF
jgi:hypothetical protein